MQAIFNESFDKDLSAHFFKSSSVGLAVFDEQLRYRMVNPYLAATHGPSAEAHFGKHVRDILGEIALQVEPAIQQVLATQQPVFNVQVLGPLPGRLHGGRWTDNFFPISDLNGGVKGVGAVVIELPKHVSFQLPHQKAVIEGGVIRSWKDIAEYVGACVKTLQRWEHAYGFPVRRLSHNKGAVVFTLTREVDDWINRRSQILDGGNTLVEPLKAPSKDRTELRGKSGKPQR